VRFTAIPVALAAALTATAALADIPAVTEARVKFDNEGVSGIYQFTVTVAHQDTGWDNYVDAWEIVAPDGQVLGVRMMFQPQVGKDRTTTGLAGVVVPEGIEQVTIRTHKPDEGYVGATKTVAIPR
jgi:peroxiredoxin